MNSVNPESEVDEFDLDVQFTDERNVSDQSMEPNEPRATVETTTTPPPGCYSYTCNFTCGGVTGHPCAC